MARAFSNRVWSVRAKLGNVEDGVDFHGGGEFETDGRAGDDFVNLVRPKPLVRQFVGGVISGNVPGIKPY